MGAGTMGAAGISRAILAFVSALAGCTSIKVDARTLAGTSWHVAAVNGRQTPGNGPFAVHFQERLFDGRFGCNSAHGSYRVESFTLVPAGVATTEMACDDASDGPHPIPLMTWERWGFAVVSRPMRMAWKSGNRLTLANSAGSIELERLP